MRESESGGVRGERNPLLRLHSCFFISVYVHPTRTLHFHFHIHSIPYITLVLVLVLSTTNQQLWVHPHSFTRYILTHLLTQAPLARRPAMRSTTCVRSLVFFILVLGALRHPTPHTPFPLISPFPLFPPLHPLTLLSLSSPATQTKKCCP